MTDFANSNRVDCVSNLSKSTKMTPGPDMLINLYNQPIVRFSTDPIMKLISCISIAIFLPTLVYSQVGIVFSS